VAIHTAFFGQFRAVYRHSTIIWEFSTAEQGGHRRSLVGNPDVRHWRSLGLYRWQSLNYRESLT
jgi:hypothetical protein